MIKAILTKPLDGHPEGAEREFDPADFETLRRMGAVRAADAARADGPTVEEYVAAGYRAKNYPPQGFASRSTADEISAAIAAQKAADRPDPLSLEGEKAGRPVDNKKAPAPANKAAPAPSTKAGEQA